MTVYLYEFLMGYKMKYLGLKSLQNISMNQNSVNNNNVLRVFAVVNTQVMQCTVISRL